MSRRECPADEHVFFDGPECAECHAPNPRVKDSAMTCAGTGKAPVSRATTFYRAEPKGECPSCSNVVALDGALIREHRLRAKR